MEQQIWKFELKPNDDQKVIPIEMPIGSKILCVQHQYYKGPCIWALVNMKDRKNLETRVFEVFGTGESFNENQRNYIGTLQYENGALVFHVFEYKGL